MGWLRKHLAYANGIPCEGTFRRVFSGLSPVAFERCFIEWVGGTCGQASRACTSRLRARRCAATRAVAGIRCIWSRRGVLIKA
ncbi:MAG: transposase family protein [Burkholderia sp.]